MACGSKYVHLLVTEDGKTPDDPWTWFAGPIDYDEWYDVAYSVRREVFRRWNWILNIEDKLSKLDDPQPAEVYPERDQLLFLLEDFQTKLEQLGHVMIEPVKNPEWTWEPAIRRAISTARDGTCVLEKLDEAANYYQRPPLPKSDPGRKSGSGKTRGGDESEGGGLGGVLITGLLATGGVLLWQRHKSKERRA